MKKKGTLILVNLIAIFIILIYLIGITYAYYKANVAVYSGKVTTTVESAFLNVDYYGDNNIKSDNLLPGWSSYIRFHVINRSYSKSTGTSVKINIKLTNFINEIGTDIKWSLSCSVGGFSTSVGCASGHSFSETSLPLTPTSTTKNVITDVQLPYSSGSSTSGYYYTLYFRYANNGNQNSQLGKKLKGIVEVTSSNLTDTSH